MESRKHNTRKIGCNDVVICQFFNGREGVHYGPKFEARIIFDFRDQPRRSRQCRDFSALRISDGRIIQLDRREILRRA